MPLATNLTSTNYSEHSETVSFVSREPLTSKQGADADVYAMFYMAVLD